MGPSSPPISDELVDVLRRSQELGFLGARPIEQVIEHARSFVTALAALAVTGPVLDQLVTLLDRRRTRTDFLARMVRRLGWQERVDVWNRDAGDVTGHPFDAVVARGFGPPSETLAFALGWVRPQGFVVISEPPTGDRWAGVVIPGATRLPSAPTVSVFQRNQAPSAG